MSATPVTSQQILSTLNEMVVGLTLSEAIASIARYMLGSEQRVAVNVLRAEAAQEDAPEAMRTRHTWEPRPVPITSDRAGGPHPRNLTLDLPWEALDEALHSRLLSGDPVSTTQRLSIPRFAAWLRDHGLDSAAMFPVMQGSQLIAVVTIASTDALALDDDAIETFSIIINQAGVLSSVRGLLDQTRTARHIIDNLALANRLITVAEDYRYMAQAIMYTLARNMTAVGITLFDRALDEGEVPLYRRVVGLCTPDDLITIDTALTYPGFLPNAGQVAKLRGSTPLIAEQIEVGETYLPALLFERGPLWMGSFGLRTADKLIGTLDIIHNDLYAFSQEELDGYTTLADQIGINITARQLLNESVEARELSARLVETNRMIALAEDYSAMAQALFHVLPDGVELAAILLFDDAITQRETPRSLRIEAVAMRGGEGFAPAMSDDLTPEALATSEAYRRLADGELVMISDTRGSAADILPNLVALLHQRDLYTLSAIGMRSGLRLMGVIAFAAHDLAAMAGMALDHLQTIAVQVATAIENRSLLDQTNEALSIASGQYEISNILYRTENPGDMLRALYRFLEGVYANAYLALTDLVDDRAEDGETPTTMGIVAEIERNQFRSSEAGQVLRTLPVPDVLRGADSPNLAFETETALTLPLMTRSRLLLGMIHFESPQPVDLAYNRRRALRNLAEQITTTLENRLLLLRNQRALQEAQTLYDLDRATSAARDQVEQLRVIREMIVPGATTLALTSLSYDLLTDQLETYVIDSVLTARIGQRVKVPLHDKLTSDDLNALKRRWEARNFEPLYVDDTAAWEGGEPFYDYLAEQWIETRAFVIVPVMDDDLMASQVCVAFDAPQRFDARLKRLFENLRAQLSIIFQNQRLLRDLTEGASQMAAQVRVLQTLNQLAINLNTTQDERVLMEDAAQALVNALRVDHAMVILNARDSTLSTVAGEFPPGDMLGVQFDAGDLQQAEVRRFRHAVTIDNVETNSGISSALRGRLLEVGVRSMTLLPLTDLRDQYIGMLALGTFAVGRPLPTDSLDVARTIGAQTVVSYQNIMQLRSTQSQAQQLQQLADFSQSIQARLDIPSILETVSAEAPLILPFDHLSVMMFDTKNQRLYLVAEYDRLRGGKQTVSADFTFNPYTALGGYQEIAGREVLLDGTTAERAWYSRSPLYVRDIARETSLRQTHLTGARSALVELLYSRGVPLGLVEIASPQAAAYTDTDVVIFKQVANQIGIAIENAQAYTQSQRVATSKALVNEISSKLQRQLDMDSILNVTVNELGRALGARRARIRLTTTVPDVPADSLAQRPAPQSTQQEGTTE